MKTQPPPNPLAPDYEAAPMQEWETKFTPFKFKSLASDGHVLPYRFYEPPALVPGMRYPVVVMLHGYGERGMDNRLQLRNFRSSTLFWEKRPCFIIAPQCPSLNEDEVWVQTSYREPRHTMKADATWPMRLAVEILNSILTNCPADADRVYLTGLSMGAFATWELLQRDAAKFAAAIPVCGGGDLAFADKLKQTPLWVFHGDADSIVPLCCSREMVAAIQAAGGQPKYTEFPGVDHEAWEPAYSNPEAWDWLFAQSKG